MNLIELLDRPIAYHRCFAKLAGSVCAGVFLSQCFYWSQRTSDVDGWFWKTRDQWAEETCLTRREQEAARKALIKIGVLEEKLVGLPAKMHYRVLIGVVQTRLLEMLQPVGTSIASKLGGSVPTGKADPPQQESTDPPNNLYTENTCKDYSIDYAQQERVAAQRAVQVCDQKFESLPEQPTEQKSQLTADQSQITPEQNLAQEITAIPLRVAAENRQQGTLTLSNDALLMQRRTGTLQGNTAADHREALIDEAIATYNQFRGAWGECAELPEGYRNRLYQISYRQRAEDKREAFLALVRDATLWAARSQWLAKPEFENKNFLFLIGRQQNEKIAEYAANWRSLSNDSKVGTAIKLSKPKEREWHDLSGRPCDEGLATIAWYALSRKAKSEPESITQNEIDWANYYFKGHDIFTKVELHDD